MAVVFAPDICFSQRLVNAHTHALAGLRTQQQLIFPPQFEDGPARLRTFMNQPDIFGVASFVAKCLALFP